MCESNIECKPVCDWKKNCSIEEDATCHTVKSISYMLPKGTSIFLTKHNSELFYIRPNSDLNCDIWFVAYDVKCGTKPVITKGTPVMCNLISESSPTPAVQLSLDKIKIINWEIISGESDVYENITRFNNTEISDIDYFYYIRTLKKGTKGTRIYRINEEVVILRNNNPNTYFLEMPTRDVLVTLTQDFCFYLPCEGYIHENIQENSSDFDTVCESQQNNCDQ